MSSRRSGILLCLIGPAGSGKSTLGGLLLKSDSDVSLSVSVTSRAPRQNEKDGVDYHFVSRERFEDRASAGEFFEWEETHGNLYGTLRAPLDAAIEEGRDLLLDVDIRGALTIKDAFPEHSVIVFIAPSSWELLERRLRDRKSGDEKEIVTRLETAKREYQSLREDFEGAKLIDYLLINDELEQAKATLFSIVHAERTCIARLSGDVLSSLSDS